MGRSWEANAAAWTAAVRGGAIPSRRAATDAAVLDAVRARAPRRVLDVGCGEGWLVRALAAEGIDARGLDGSAALVEAAREAGGHFERLSYAELTLDPRAAGEDYDVVVLNFALFEEDPAPLLRALGEVLVPGGALVIQTLHPWSAHGAEYRDGWRTERFEALDGFREPMEWYFRTLPSWIELLRRAGFMLDRLGEPLHPESGAPLSLLLEATRFADLSYG